LFMIPQMRKGSRLKKFQPKPTKPNTKEVPSRVNATGNPAISKTVRATNIQRGRNSANIAGSLLRIPAIFLFQRTTAEQQHAFQAE